MRGFWLGMAVHLWQTTLVLAVLVILDRFMRRAPARFRHLLWSAGLFTLAAICAVIIAGTWRYRVYERPDAVDEQLP